MLPLIGYTIVRYLRLPSGYTVLLVLFATQLPDLIDKPLAWTFGIIPSGRMLAHSIVVSVPILCIGCLLAARWGRGRAGLLFTVAYLSHLAGDFYPILWLQTEYYYFPNFFWPILEANPDYERSFAAYIPEGDMTLFVLVGAAVLIIGYAVVDVTVRTRRARN